MAVGVIIMAKGILSKGSSLMLFSVIILTFFVLSTGVKAQVESTTIKVGFFDGSISGTSGTLTVGDNSDGTSSLTGTFGSPTITGDFEDGTYLIVADDLKFEPEGIVLPGYEDTQDFVGIITIEDGNVALDGTLTPGFNTSDNGDTHQ
ncbi:MAG: hypothetical protein PWQ28_519, partial [Candidatus Woesearchaeota archaeon]|nr:hypothetical protein [Candidatus Woesearchaeota archaeon]